MCFLSYSSITGHAHALNGFSRLWFLCYIEIVCACLAFLTINSIRLSFVFILEFFLFLHFFFLVRFKTSFQTLLPSINMYDRKDLFASSDGTWTCHDNMNFGQPTCFIISHSFKILLFQLRPQLQSEPVLSIDVLKNIFFTISTFIVCQSWLFVVHSVCSSHFLFLGKRFVGFNINFVLALPKFWFVFLLNVRSRLPVDDL